MKMKKILAIVLSAIMIVGSMAIVSAEGTTVEVSANADLIAALNAGSDVKITDNFTVDEKVTVPDGTVIDLNGKTLYWNVENSYFGTSTVKNGNIIFGKDDVNVCDGYFLINESETLTLDGVNITSSVDGMKCYCVFHLKTGAAVDVKNSTINVAKNEYAPGYVVYANEATAKVDFTNSTVTTEDVAGVVHAATTITSSSFTVKGTEGTKMEHGINRSAVTITDSDVSISGGTGRGITPTHGPLVINGNSTVEIYDMAEASIQLRNNQTVTVAETASVSVDTSVTKEDKTTVTVAGVTINENLGAVAKIGSNEYATLSEALKALKSGDTLTILSDITITEAWNSRSGNGGQIDVPVTIDGGNHTIKFACDVQDGNNYHTPIRATKDIVVKNLTMDMSEAINSKDTTRIRALAFTSSATIENCTFIGNGYTRGRGICFGEGATAEALSQATVSIKGCTFKNWSRGVIDNESGSREVKSISITDSAFENSGITVSASESITVTGNTVTGAYVSIKSYTNPDACEVRATGNTLTANEGAYENRIHNGVLVEVQDGFVVPVATTLPEAVNGVITLTEDVELEAAYTVEKGETVVIDLNGKTITYNSTTQGEAMITNKGKLTIEDSVGTGVINYNYTGAADPSYGKGNYTISNAGTLTVDGGKITIANLSSHAKYPIDNNSTTGDAILVVNGGHLYNYNTSAIRQFCNSTTNKNSVTINGGLIEGYSAIWVQNPGSQTVNGKLEITGGEIKSTAKAYVNGTAQLDEVGSKIYCTIAGDGGAWSEDSAVSITGGTINENVYFAEEAPEKITVSENATFNGYIELPEVVEKELPNAEVKNLGSVTIPAGDYICYPSGSNAEDLNLDVAMQFIANDTPEEAAKNYYGNYTTDFFIEFSGLTDGVLDTTGCYLAGNYGEYGWIAIPVDGIIETVEEGVVYPVLSGATPLDFKYVDICREVKDFSCGIYFSDDIKEKHPNITVKLSLGLSETVEDARNAEFTAVGAYTYDKDDFGKQLVNWGTGTDAGYYMDGETKYGMMRFLFHADVNAEDVIDSGIKYIRTDDITASVVSKQNDDATNAFYGDVTGIPDGTTGEYAAVAYIVTSKGFIYWSDAAVCSPDFTKHFTEYTAQ